MHLVNMKSVIGFLLWCISFISGCLAMDLLSNNDFLPLASMELYMLGGYIGLVQSIFVIGQFSEVSAMVQFHFMLHCIASSAFAVSMVLQPQYSVWLAILILVNAIIIYWRNCSWIYEDEPGIHAAVAVIPTVMGIYLTIVLGFEKIHWVDQWVLGNCALTLLLLITGLLVVKFSDVTTGFLTAYLSIAVALRENSLGAAAGGVILATLSSMQWYSPRQELRPLLG